MRDSGGGWGVINAIELLITTSTTLTTTTTTYTDSTTTVTSTSATRTTSTLTTTTTSASTTAVVLVDDGEGGSSSGDGDTGEDVGVSASGNAEGGEGGGEAEGAMEDGENDGNPNGGSADGPTTVEVPVITTPSTAQSTGSATSDTSERSGSNAVQVEGSGCVAMVPSDAASQLACGMLAATGNPQCCECTNATVGVNNGGVLLGVFATNCSVAQMQVAQRQALTAAAAVAAPSTALTSATGGGVGSTDGNGACTVECCKTLSFFVAAESQSACTHQTSSCGQECLPVAMVFEGSSGTDSSTAKRTVGSAVAIPATMGVLLLLVFGIIYYRSASGTTWTCKAQKRKGKFTLAAAAKPGATTAEDRQIHSTAAAAAAAFSAGAHRFEPQDSAAAPLSFTRGKSQRDRHLSLNDMGVQGEDPFSLDWSGGLAAAVAKSKLKTVGSSVSLNSLRRVSRDGTPPPRSSTAEDLRAAKAYQVELRESKHVDPNADDVLAAAANPAAPMTSATAVDTAGVAEAPRAAAMDADRLAAVLRRLGPAVATLCTAGLIPSSEAASLQAEVAAVQSGSTARRSAGGGGASGYGGSSLRLVAALDRLGPALAALCDAGLIPAAEAAALKAEVLANMQSATGGNVASVADRPISVGNTRRASVSSSTGRRTSLLSSV